MLGVRSCFVVNIVLTLLETLKQWQGKRKIKPLKPL